MTKPNRDSRFLADLGRSVEDADPIAWGSLSIDRHGAYELIASQIAEMFERYDRDGLPSDEQLTIALGTLVKLTVENFVLHQRLMRESVDVLAQRRQPRPDTDD